MNDIRFGFGDNWLLFFDDIDASRVINAESSLKMMLGVESLKDKSFLDIGCGSGLFSLAARRLGANVHSFDFDINSVKCTQALQKNYFSKDSGWTIEQGSILDINYINQLGKFDYVYAWGVLHHTGEMWKALSNAERLVKSNGALFIAIYNDQGWISRYWTQVKKIYNKNKLGRILMVSMHSPYLIFGRIIIRKLSGKGNLGRGMSYWRDLHDWLGGYPFEVAKPAEIVKFYENKNFHLSKLVTCGNRHGCNEFIFTKTEL